MRHICSMFPLLFFLLIGSCSSTPGFALPGSWSDTSGKLIQSHAPGIILVDGLYYMFGENKTSGTFFHSIPCYSSSDLVEWTLVKDALVLQKSGDLGPNRIVERPKVIYNDANKMFVMHVHIDDSIYSEARFGTAVSSTVCGPYKYLRSKKPFGNQSRDLGLFKVEFLSYSYSFPSFSLGDLFKFCTHIKDDDKKAYLLSEDREHGLQIYLLNDHYLDVTGTGPYHTFKTHDYEAPALFKHEGIYYIMGSYLTGWKTNDNQYSSSKNLSGGWSPWSGFAATGSSTYNSQTTFVLPVKGNESTTFLFMSDRWFPDDLAHSQYIWLPMQVSKGKMHVPWYGSWNLDVKKGTWSGVNKEIFYQAESSSNKFPLNCFVFDENVGYLDGWAIRLCPLGTIGIELEVETTGNYTVKLRYLMRTSTQSYAFVNGYKGNQTVALPPSALPQSVSLTVPLLSGKNKITLNSPSDFSLDAISVLLF